MSLARRVSKKGVGADCERRNALLRHGLERRVDLRIGACAHDLELQPHLAHRLLRGDQQRLGGRRFGVDQEADGLRLRCKLGAPARSVLPPARA